MRGGGQIYLANLKHEYQSASAMPAAQLLLTPYPSLLQFNRAPSLALDVEHGIRQPAMDADGFLMSSIMLRPIAIRRARRRVSGGLEHMG